MIQRSYKHAAAKVIAYLKRFKPCRWPPWLIERGRICRTVLAKRLRLPVSALRQSPYLTAIIDECNKALKANSIESSKYDRFAIPLKQLLENLRLHDRLPIEPRTKLVNRSELARQLGMPVTPLLKNSRCRRALRAFEIAVPAQLLTPKPKHRHLKNKLLKILESRTLPRAKTGHWELSAIAKCLGLPQHVVQQDKFLRKIIAEQEATTRAKMQLQLQQDTKMDAPIELDPLIPKHKRRYDFTFMPESYGIGFTVQLIQAFLSHESKYSAATTPPRYRALSSFFRYASTEELELVKALQQGKCTIDCLQAAALKWHEWFISSAADAKDTTQSAQISVLNQALNYLAEAQVLPPIKSLPTPRINSLGVRPKPTLAEITPDTSAKALMSETNAEISDKTAFENSLAYEYGTSNTSNKIDAINSINSTRLFALREVAVRLLKKEYKHFRFGQILMRSAGMTGKEIETALLQCSSIPVVRSRQFELIFPDTDKKVCSGRHLVFLRYKFGTRPPVKIGSESDSWVNFYRRKRKSTSDYHIKSLLGIRDLGVAAALTIYLIDSGTNVDVGRRLKISNIRQSDTPRSINVSGNKPRAGNKIIENDLPTKTSEEISTAKALSMIIEMTQSLRGETPPESQDYVFLLRGRKNVIDVIPAFRYTIIFKKMLRYDKKLANLPLLPAMIRPSLLLDKTLAHKGSIGPAHAAADHANYETTVGYINRLPQKLDYDRRIRRFQQDLESVIIHDISGAAKLLGIPACRSNNILLVENRTGLGTVCKNRRMESRIHNRTGDCVELESCVGCSNLMVVSHPDIIADMLHWNEVLESNKDDMVKSNPERWYSKWEQWRILTIVIIEKIKSGPHAKVYMQATKLLEERKAAGLTLPKPW